MRDPESEGVAELVAEVVSVSECEFVDCTVFVADTLVVEEMLAVSV